MNARLSSQTYGKHQVHISRVLREGPDASRHRLVQVAVDVELQGDFDAAYTQADNHNVIATDTCKNIVHNVALDHPMSSIEQLGQSIVQLFMDRYAHVHTAKTTLRQTVWSAMSGCSHAFVSDHDSKPTATITATRGRPLAIEAGIQDLMIAKTTQSGFSDFHRDEYRTLPDTDDRILATSLTSTWTYGSPIDDYEGTRQQVMSALLDAFADHYSHSVQETLMKMGTAVLDVCSAVERIVLVMPNKHHVPVDMSPFGRENHNDLFVVSPEPYGYIEAEVARET